MNFKKLSQYLQKLEKTAPRLEKTAILAELFDDLVKETNNNVIEETCYLIQGQLVPRYESLEFQLSVKMVLKAIARVAAKVDENNSGSLDSGLGADSNGGSNALNLFNEVDFTTFEKDVLQRYKKLGDVGLVAEEVLSAKDTAKGKDEESNQLISILETHAKLVKIAQDNGSGSQDRKVDLLESLLTSLDPISAKFVSRIIIGKLRLGFSTMTIMDALSWTKKQDKSDAKMLDLAYQKKADIGKLASLYLLEENSITALDKYSVEVGIPVVPALCQRLNTSVEIIEKMGEVLVEPKYDGLRIQIHIKKPTENVEDKNALITKAYTRNLEDVSHMFPELIQAANQLSCKSCILDAEAIGFNPDTGKLLPFQDTITRKRKHGVAEQATSVPIRFYVFDILAVDDESLLDERLDTRKERLTSLLGKPEVVGLSEQKSDDNNFNNKNPLKNTFFITTSDPSELKEFHESQLGDGLEGAVIKKIDSKYRSGRKGWRWVKIKEEEGSRGKLSDTVDCVVMGYYFGRGKRAEFGMGALLVGVIDNGKDEKKNENISSEPLVKTIAKIGTGLSDVQLVEIKKLADDSKFVKNSTSIDNNQTFPSNYVVDKNLYPDVWVEPNIVVEIAADEITRSPIHSAGKALRFPRLVKVRGDKDWGQATTLKELDSIG